MIERKYPFYDWKATSCGSGFVWYYENKTTVKRLVASKHGMGNHRIAFNWARNTAMRLERQRINAARAPQPDFPTE